MRTSNLRQAMHGAQGISLNRSNHSQQFAVFAICWAEIAIARRDNCPQTLAKSGVTPLDYRRTKWVAPKAPESLPTNRVNVKQQAHAVGHRPKLTVRPVRHTGMRKTKNPRPQYQSTGGPRVRGGD